ncbi:MAG: hypothetical protein AAF542_15755 [Pseudomonadota bacterium]
MTGIASDFNALMLGISDQAQRALTDTDKDTSHGTSDISDRLTSVMESSRHAHELIVKMLAYRSAASDSPKSADLSETVRRTMELIKQSIGADYKLTANIEDDLYAQELDVVHLQKMLIQLFRLAAQHVSDNSTSRANKKAIQLEMRLNDYQAQRCFCCDKEVSGQFLLLGISHGSMRRSATIPSETLANAFSEDPALFSRLGALHSELDEHRGHLLLQQSNNGAQYWQAIVPIANAEQSGLNLDNSVQLEKYRQRRKKPRA